MRHFGKADQLIHFYATNLKSLIELHCFNLGYNEGMVYCCILWGSTHTGVMLIDFMVICVTYEIRN